MRASERVYRWLIHAYPKPFRAEFEDEMVRLFREQLKDARESGASGVSVLWIRTIADVVSSAPGQHARQRAAQARTAQGVPMTLQSPAGLTRAQRTGFGLAAVPTVVAGAMSLFLPSVADVVGSKSLLIIGLPVGIVVLFLAIVWSLLALPILRITRSAIGVSATLLAFTVPSLFVILTVPGAIVIVLSLNI